MPAKSARKVISLWSGVFWRGNQRIQRTGKVPDLKSYQFQSYQHRDSGWSKNRHNYIIPNLVETQMFDIYTPFG